MADWREIKDEDDNDKQISRAYMGLLSFMANPQFTSQVKMLRENNSQFISLMNSIAKMDEAIRRGGPKV